MNEDFYQSGRPKNKQILSTGALHCNRTAATEIFRIKFFTQSLVTEVRASILTAGTAAASKLTIYKNTTSIGEIACSTNTAGSTVDASLTDTFFTASDSLVIKNATSDLNLEATCFIDYYENHERTD